MLILKNILTLVAAICMGVGTSFLSMRVTGFWIGFLCLLGGTILQLLTMLQGMQVGIKRFFGQSSISLVFSWLLALTTLFIPWRAAQLAIALVVALFHFAAFTQLFFLHYVPTRAVPQGYEHLVRFLALTGFFAFAVLMHLGVLLLRLPLFGMSFVFGVGLAYFLGVVLWLHYFDASRVFLLAGSLGVLAMQLFYAVSRLPLAVPSMAGIELGVFFIVMSFVLQWRNGAKLGAAFLFLLALLSPWR